MTVLSNRSLREIRPVEPFEEKTIFHGMSYGVSHCGYDIRIAEDIFLAPNSFSLASSIEKFKMPKNVVGIVHDKSTWARKGLQVQNTVIEPGWEGYLTLELTLANIIYRSPDIGFRGLQLLKGMPIAQIIFHWIDEAVDGYTGKYQNQESGPQGARFE